MEHVPIYKSEHDFLFFFFVKTVHPQIELSADTLMWMFLPTLTYFIIQKAFG